MPRRPGCRPTSAGSLRSHMSEVKTIRLVTSENGEIREDDEGEYFDDCPICMAMKLADAEERDLGLEELSTAFKSTAALPGVVSSFGECDEPPD